MYQMATVKLAPVIPCQNLPKIAKLLFGGPKHESYSSMLKPKSAR